MTLAEKIAQLRERIAARLAERNTYTTELREVRATIEAAETPAESDLARVTELRGLVSAIDVANGADEVEIGGLLAEQARDDAADRLARDLTPTGVRAPAYDDVARVSREERTYSQEKDRRGTASFFADAFRMRENQDQEAIERINRHAREVEVEGEMTTRATSTGSFAGLIVPQYLVDQAALVARAGRPFANTLQSLPLPDQGTQFQIPRGTTGAATAIQSTENSNVQSTDEVWANVTVPVGTIAGQQDVSRQSLERGTPGIDQLIYLDLAGAYAVNLDQQVLSGTGTSGQLTGVLNTSGINQASAFTAAATPATFYSKVAGQVNAVETTRFMAPNMIAMHPRRWNWLVSQVDSSNRPLVVPNSNGPFNAFATFDEPVDTPSPRIVGVLQGLPVITDASIPTAVGTGPEDQVLVYRNFDILLWEDGDGLPRQLRFEQTLGNQLTVKLVAYGYAAVTAGRYPAAVGVVGGNAGTAGYGLVAPSF